MKICEDCEGGWWDLCAYGTALRCPSCYYGLREEIKEHHMTREAADRYIDRTRAEIARNYRETSREGTPCLECPSYAKCLTLPLAFPGIV